MSYGVFLNFVGLDPYMYLKVQNTLLNFLLIKKNYAEFLIISFKIDFNFLSKVRFTSWKALKHKRILFCKKELLNKQQTTLKNYSTI
jgi:hypothetical protein